MTKNSKPVLTALPPGTALLAIDEAQTTEGEIHFNAEPAFVVIYDGGRASVLGLLDHETPLGVLGPRHSQVAYTLVPAGTSPEDLEGFVAATYARLFTTQAPYQEPPSAPEEALTGVVSPPPPSDSPNGAGNPPQGEQETAWTVIDTPQ